MRFSGNGWIKVENEKRGSGWNGEGRREREIDRKKKKMREIGTYSVWRACCWSGLGAELQAAGMAASSNPRNLWFASRSRPPRSLLALSPRCTETWCLWQKKKKNNIHHHHHRPRWTNDILRTLFFPFHRHTNWWIRESKKNSKSFKINAALKRNTNAYYYVNAYAYIRTMIRDSERNTETGYCFRVRILISKYYNRGNYIGIR